MIVTEDYIEECKFAAIAAQNVAARYHHRYEMSMACGHIGGAVHALMMREAASRDAMAYLTTYLALKKPRQGRCSTTHM